MNTEQAKLLKLVPDMPHVWQFVLGLFPYLTSPLQGDFNIWRGFQCLIRIDAAMLAGAVQSSWSEAPLRNVLAHQSFLRNQEQDSELVLPSLEVLRQQSASVQASFQTKSLQCDLGSSFAISSLEKKDCY